MATGLTSLSTSAAQAESSLSTGLSGANTALAGLSSSTATSLGSLSTSSAQAVGSLSTSTAQAITSLSTGLASDGTTISALQAGLNAGTIGLVQQASGASAGAITIGAGTAGTVLNVAGTAGARQVKGVAAGTDASDAVNLQQLQSVATQAGTIGASAVGYDDASHTRVTFGTAGSPVALTNVADGALSASSTDAVTGRQLYAQQQATSANAGAIATLSTASMAATSSLSTGIADNTSLIAGLSTSTTDALASLSTGTSRGLASLSTGLSSTDATVASLQSGLAAGTVGLVQQAGTGSITIGGNAAGTVLDVAGTAGARQVKGVAAGSDATDAVNLQQLQSVAAQTGAVGSSAVAYDDASHMRVTLGPIGAGAPVTLTNVADGAVSATSTDAVAGRQLYAAEQATTAVGSAIASLSTSTDQSVASLTSGLASTTMALGSLSTGSAAALTSLSTGQSAAEATLANLSTGTAQAVTSLSTGLATSGTTLAALQSSLAAGTVGIVQQDASTGTGLITIGAGTGGSAVDLSGSAGPRQVKGVAAGTDATDAVNLQQLQSVTAAVGNVGTGAVAYDDASHSRITLGAPAAGTVALTNVADAALSAASTDAVAGRQLYATNQAIGTTAAAVSTLSTATGLAVSSLSTGLSDNGASLAALQSGLAAGTVGLVQQAGGLGNGVIQVGAGMAGSAVNFAGTAGARQLKGVAAGTDATDGVNLQQLQSVAAALGAVGAGAVSYDDASRSRITLGAPGAGVPVTLTNVADATLSASSTDAVSGRQLYATNQTVSSLAGQLAAGTVGLVQQSASGITVGAATGGTTLDVSGTAGARRISGVAAGVSATDAVNVGQLDQVIGTVNTIAGNTLSYDDPTKLSVTLGGLGAGSAVSIHNLAAGALTAASSDAVNGAQLFATNAAVTANTGAINALSSRLGAILPSSFSQTIPEPGQGSLKYAAFNSTGSGSIATGAEAIAVGSNAAASGDRSTALGAGAATSATNAVAVGSNASATGANAVALGAGSVADRDDSVSIGNASTGTTRVLANVSAGTAPTDAVNVQQLNDSVTNLSNRLDHDRRDANGGIAAAVAIASLPQAPAPGRSMVAIGGGTYGGQSAMALGISTYAGRWILKANGSTDTRGTVAAGVGAGFVW
ncbi:YadA family autotransporter adhesin [Burkholderia gladioli]|uniref:YadA family autotransporter adhesin n=1 Tax=Burkholderia gladioli TaxID=28095 RepID=UPI001640F3FA|nr:YadA-like family protein [Burkholderia gladioli]